jgi:hypothetical protein
MLKLFKGRKKLLLTIIMMVLGWAGVNTDMLNVSSLLGMVEEAQQENAEKYPNHNADKDIPISPEQYPDNTTATEQFNKASAISPQRRVHILYGDKTGGGHKHGVGKPCKSEFPADWSDDTIIETVERIAANDNLNWKKQRNGYYVTEKNVDDLRVRVVKGRDGASVITAYPTNVKRNACPRHANDN